LKGKADGRAPAPGKKEKGGRKSAGRIFTLAIGAWGRELKTKVKQKKKKKKATKKEVFEVWGKKKGKGRQIVQESVLTEI